MNAFVTHLGDAYAGLDELVRQAHSGEIRLEGPVRVRRGNRLASLLCDVLGLPPSAESVQLVVDGRHLPDCMEWERDFGGVKMVSRFVLQGEHLVERMGPVRLWLKLACLQGRLEYRLVRASIWGLPLPGRLRPTLEANEMEEGGCYRFRVAVGLPLVGRLIEYAGRLRLQDGRGEQPG